VVVIVATVAGMLLLLPSGASVALDVRRSALRTSPDGVAGWARSLEELQRPAVMRFDSYARTTPTGEAQVLLEPLVEPTDAEISSLLTWVRSGGLLVYSAGSDGVLLDSVDVLSGPLLDPEAARVASHRWTDGLSPGDVRPTFESRSPARSPVRRGVRSTAAGWIPLVEFARSSPSPPAEGDSTVESEEREDLATAGWRPIGDGGVLVLADAAPLDNERLSDSPEAVIATRAILEWTAAGDVVRYSEYHQGIRGTGSAIGLAWGRLHGHPVGRVVVWAVIWGSFAIWAAGRRFGSPIPQNTSPRRSPIEHVRALAEIYRQAGADRIVADRLVTGAARRAGLDTRLAVDPARAIEWWSAHSEDPDLAERSRVAWQREPPDLQALSDALDQLAPTSTDP